MDIGFSDAPRKFVRKIAFTLALVLGVILVFAAHQVAGARPQAAVADDPAALLEGYRHAEVASVSDAMEQLTGRKMYMTHHMRPIFPTKFAGFAVTVLLKKEANEDPTALNGMLAAIDQGAKDSVYVMVVEDGVDIAGMGGLMGTAMYSREFAGAVIDGGVRDTAYLKKIGARIVVLGADEHDHLVAYSSHLPQLASTAMASMIAEVSPDSAQVAGPGLTDSTRLALSSYDLWRDIVSTNTDPIVEALTAYIQKLDHLRENLRTRQLQDEFTAAAAFAKQLRKPEA